MVRAGLLFCLFWCWDPPFKVEAGVQYSWGVQNVQGIFKLPEQHLKSAPIQEVTWPDSEAYRPDATKSNPLPHVLPMFQHAPVPLANAQLFRPVAGHQQLPNSLVGLLLPSRKIPHASEQTPDQLPYPISASKVEVSCGSSMISVRVNRGQLGFDAHSSTFRLGTCPVRLETPEYFYFTYFHSECGSVSTVVNGKLVFSNTVHYSPEPQGAVLRAVPLSVPVHCQYDRFHYSYKVGYTPETDDRFFLKRLKTRRSFNLTALNEKWEPRDSGEEYVLGEVMNFEVSAQHIAKDQQVFVNTCHVTASEDPNSMPRQDLISNFGCLVDSKRMGSQAQFFSRESNRIRFSIDSFLFPNVDTMRLYLHCSVNVGSANPTETTKSCAYNRQVDSWEELRGYPSVCSCCRTTCGLVATSTPSLKSLLPSDRWKMVQQRLKSAPPQQKEDGETLSTQVSFKLSNGIIHELDEDVWEEDPEDMKSNSAQRVGHLAWTLKNALVPKERPAPQSIGLYRAGNVLPYKLGSLLSKP
ncbi:zona pellucida glycoprotein 3d tandem duplicate 1 [Engraulis encrasicolus]|uniref:zona pellucida glycoprotein 3d tandem duplicate 1 n=1 Tax=Engraulis encrasicolus TaxID=184585 RepID=UPI002FD4B14D